mgnify:CR=1 FL=1
MTGINVDFFLNEVVTQLIEDLKFTLLLCSDVTMLSNGRQPIGKQMSDAAVKFKGGMPTVVAM